MPLIPAALGDKHATLQGPSEHQTRCCMWTRITANSLEGHKWELSLLSHRTCEGKTSSVRSQLPHLRTHPQQLLAEARQDAGTGSLWAPGRLPPCALGALRGFEWSWCRKTVPICSQTLVTWQASHTEATTGTNMSLSETCTLSKSSLGAGEPQAEAGPAARPCPFLFRGPHLGHFQVRCDPCDTSQAFLFKGRLEY